MDIGLSIFVALLMYGSYYYGVRVGIWRAKYEDMIRQGRITPHKLFFEWWMEQLGKK